MKASELINMLHDVMENNGDLPVKIFVSDDMNPCDIEGICMTLQEGNETPLDFTICDQETLEAFS